MTVQPWQRRRLARVSTEAQRLATTYLAGEPIISEDATSPNCNRPFFGDGVTPGGLPLAFQSDVSAAVTALQQNPPVPTTLADSIPKKGQGAPDGNYNPANNVPIYTPLRTLLRDWRHVADNGADPANPDNSLPLIYALAEGAARGQRVVMGAGTYTLLTQPAYLRNLSRLEGQGPGRSILRLADTAGFALISCLDQTTRLGNTKLKVSGLTLDVNGTKPANANLQAFQLIETAGASIEDVEIINAGANALNIAPLDNQPGAPYTYSPPTTSASQTFAGTTTVGSNVISSVTFGPTKPAVGSSVSGTGIPAGSHVTGVYATQVSIGANATASGAVTFAFSPAYKLPTPPDGTDWYGHYDLTIRNLNITSIASLGGVSGGGFGNPLADLGVLYHINGGLAENIIINGGGANQFSWGMCRHFSLSNLRLRGGWRGLYQETNIQCDAQDIYWESIAAQPIHPYLVNDPPRGSIIDTAEESYSSGQAGVVGAPYDGGRSVTIRQFAADGIINTFSNRGPEAISLNARTANPSKNILIVEPAINNLQAIGPPPPGGGAATPATGIKAYGGHQDLRVTGGRISVVNRVFDDGADLGGGGSQQLVRPSIDGLTMEAVNDIAINISGAANAIGIRVANNNFGVNVNVALGPGVTSIPGYRASCNIGSDAGGPIADH